MYPFLRTLLRLLRARGSVLWSVVFVRGARWRAWGGLLVCIALAVVAASCVRRSSYIYLWTERYIEYV